MFHNPTRFHTLLRAETAASPLTALSTTSCGFALDHRMTTDAISKYCSGKVDASGKRKLDISILNSSFFAKCENARIKIRSPGLYLHLTQKTLVNSVFISRLRSLSGKCGVVRPDSRAGAPNTGNVHESLILSSHSRFVIISS